MRLSSNKEDPGYFAFTQRRKAKIKLNGQELFGCIMADDELGEVEMYLRDAKGQWLIDPEREEIMTVTLRGKVEIDASDGA